jgi:hypothetical protein
MIVLAHSFGGSSPRSSVPFLWASAEAIYDGGSTWGSQTAHLVSKEGRRGRDPDPKSPVRIRLQRPDLLLDPTF